MSEYSPFPAGLNVNGRSALVNLSAVIRHPRDLSRLEIETWRQFQTASSWLDSPFFAPEFTLAAGLARDDTRVAILQQDSAVVGFFPYHLVSRGIAKPVGGPVSDYQGPILAPGTDLSASSLLEACGLRAYDFNHCPAELKPLADGGFISSTSPRAVLRDGYDAYFAAVRSSQKESIRTVDRNFRRLQRDGGIVKFQLDDRRPECWDWLVAMKTKALAAQGIKAGFGIPWMMRLFGELRAMHAPEFSGLMSTLSLNDRIIAAHFGLRAGPVLCWWHTTYDEEFSRVGPGLVLILLTIREGAKEGISVIDFGRGDQRYKRTFANGSYKLCEGSIARPGSIAAALRSCHKFVSDVSSRLPLGKYESYPRRASGRLISNVGLPR